MTRNHKTYTKPQLSGLHKYYSLETRLDEPKGKKQFNDL